MFRILLLLAGFWHLFLFPKKVRICKIGCSQTDRNLRLLSGLDQRSLHFLFSAPLVCIFGVGNGTASAAYMVSAGLLIRYFFFARPEATPREH